MKKFLKTYFFWVGWAFGLFVWFLLLGPIMLSAPDMRVWIWVLATIFGVIPFAGYSIYKYLANLVKETDVESNS